MGVDKDFKLKKISHMFENLFSGANSIIPCYKWLFNKEIWRLADKIINAITYNS